MTKDLKLFIWDAVDIPDFCYVQSSGGLAVALAESKKDAIELVIDRVLNDMLDGYPDEYVKKCREAKDVGSLNGKSGNFAYLRFQLTEYEPKVYKLDKPRAWFCDGSNY
jgi:hypothetical protein